MSNQLEDLNRLSLFRFRDLFTSLEPPRREALRGTFQGKFVGPGWLRRLGGPLLVITRMGDWRGKDFDSQGNAINLVWHRGQIVRRFPMNLLEQDSLIDHKPGLALSYAPTNPFPWPWIIDELRSIQPGIVLGMSIARFELLQRLPLPFLLQSQEELHGL